MHWSRTMVRGLAQFPPAAMCVRRQSRAPGLVDDAHERGFHDRTDWVLTGIVRWSKMPHFKIDEQEFSQRLYASNPLHLRRRRHGELTAVRNFEKSSLTGKVKDEAGEAMGRGPDCATR